MSDVVRDPSFTLFRSNIASPALRAVADHWLAARAEKRMPSWADLSPAAMAPHLTKIWTFRYDSATDEFYARLAGNRIMVGFGQSFRGTPLKDLHSPEVYQKCFANQKRLITEPTIFRSSGRIFKVGDQVIRGERIALPLATDGYHGDGTLGATEYDFKILGRLDIELIYENEEWYPL